MRRIQLAVSWAPWPRTHGIRRPGGRLRFEFTLGCHGAGGCRPVRAYCEVRAHDAHGPASFVVLST